MPYDSHLTRNELFVAAAVVAAHASFFSTGFRQRDVRFFIELFSNWVELSLEDSTLRVQNTQLARYLENIVKDGFGRKVSRSGPPHYRLTRSGLLELISRIVDRSERPSRAHFYFLYYFISNHRTRIEALVKQEGERFPYSLKIELEALLDLETLVEKELVRTNREVKRMQRRIDDAVSTAQYVSAGLKKGAQFEVLVKEVERMYPYELNSQKPLSELINSIQPEQRRWELEVGNTQRVEQIWKPSLTQLNAHLETLKHLKRAAK